MGGGGGEKGSGTRKIRQVRSRAINHSKQVPTTLHYTATNDDHKSAVNHRRQNPLFLFLFLDHVESVIVFDEIPNAAGQNDERNSVDLVGQKRK